MSLVALVLSLVVPVRGELNKESQSRLLNDIKFLADDGLQGRGIGTEGLDKAAVFIKDEFAKAGLDVSSVDGGAFHKFQMTTGSVLGKTNTLTFNGPGNKKISLKLGKDFQTCSFGGSAKFAKGIVLCGYGITSKKPAYDDFANVDVKDKIVIIMRRVPQQANPKGPFGGVHGQLSQHAGLRSKVGNAFGKGAAAVLFVNDPYSIRNDEKKANEAVAKAKDAVVKAAEAFDKADAKDEKKTSELRTKLSQQLRQLKSAQKRVTDANFDPLMRFGYGGNGDNRKLPILHITRDACDRLLKEAFKKSLADFSEGIDRNLKPRSMDLITWKAEGETSVTRTETELKNVIGVLEGEGPLADETIVIGAHYDHVGMGGQGSLLPGSKAVHNGADDNASGTVSLIELARRLGTRKKKLPRRLVFIAFTAEERGLIGSARYVKNPTFPLDKTVAMFNMDMVGRLRDDKITIFGTGTAKRFKGQIDEAGKKGGFKVTHKPSGFGPSDHSSFYAKKIPVLHFFTGTHGDYHRPSDDWQKINIVGINRISDMIEELVVTTAETKERPQYLEVKRPAAIRRGGNRPYFGSIPEFGSDQPGYAISGVSKGSPADKGGLKGGDHIIQLGKNKIGNLSDFDLALRKFKAGDAIDIVVMRKGKKVPLKVTLGKPR
jgi:hypothetical protein